MWIFYAILAPFCNAIDSLGEKFLVDKQVDDAIVVIFNEGLLYVIFGLSILLWHKIAPLSFLQIGALLIAGMLFIYYLIPYFKALTQEDTSRIIPLFQFIPLFVLLLSFLFLKEAIPLKEFFGFIIILCGGFILSAEKVEEKIFKPRKAMWYMLLSSFLYACSPILFKFAVVKTDFWTAFFYQALGGGIGAASLLLYPPYRKSVIKEGLHVPLVTWIVMSVNQAVAIAAELSSSFAFSLAPVALVSVITGTQPLFTLLFAVILSVWFPHILKENISKSVLGTKLFSIFLILGGLLFLYL